MSFKKELEEIIETLVSLTKDGLTLLDYDGEKVTATEPKDQALTSIINLVDKELPEFIDIGEYDLDCPPTDLHRAAGYNQALTDMRNKLRGEIDGN